MGWGFFGGRGLAIPVCSPENRVLQVTLDSLVDDGPAVPGVGFCLYGKGIGLEGVHRKGSRVSAGVFTAPQTPPHKLYIYNPTENEIPANFMQKEALWKRTLSHSPYGENAAHPPLV